MKYLVSPAVSLALQSSLLEVVGAIEVGESIGHPAEASNHSKFMRGVGFIDRAKFEVVIRDMKGCALPLTTSFIGTSMRRNHHYRSTVCGNSCSVRKTHFDCSSLEDSNRVVDSRRVTIANIVSRGCKWVASRRRLVAGELPSRLLGG